ncbi:hypothetical protein PENDEC_c001G05780 [Penicillium decumbens]|uniref:Uncharacterized protein n=1 Tax=Penicillium decumbens TaxID=69771 RepID=A0A1V6PNW7_PENDC|nr:hypothetical protein PENDEC_c001G05780 [Penicillium decumbens]
MHFSGLMFVLVASTSIVIAAPTDNNSAVSEWTCPNGWTLCGTCNGTSCKIGGINYDCDDGTSCVGDGGGDGALCGSDNNGDVICPVKK